MASELGFQFDPIFQEDLLWYFWDETWSSYLGPYETKIEAEYYLDLYCKSLNRPHKLEGKPPIGSTVTWESFSNGQWTRKTGIVIYSSNPLKPWHVINRRELNFPRILKFASNGMLQFRQCKSGVIVQVNRTGKRGDNLIPYLYAPRLKDLEIVSM